MNKKQLWEGLRVGAAVVSLSVLGWLAIGCGEKATPTTTDKPVMNLWYADYKEDSIQNALSSIGAQTVTLKERKLPAGIFEAKSVDSIAADEAPDVWLIPNDWLADHLNKIVTIPSDFWVAAAKDTTGGKTTLENFKLNYPQYIVDDLTVNTDHVIGFPGPVKTLVLFKNQDLFSAAWSQWNKDHQNASQADQDHVRQILTQQLKTWDQVVEASKLLTAKTGNFINVSGLAMGTATNVPTADDIVQLLTFQQGGKVVNAVERIALFDGFEKTADGRQVYPGREAMNFYTSFANPTNANYSWNSGMGDARQAFLDGKVAMMIDYPDFEDAIKQAKKVNYQIAPVPQLYADKDPVNFAKYYVFVVTKATQDQKKAAAFAKSFTQTGVINQVARGLTGSVSPFKSSFADSEISGKQALTAKTVYKRKHVQFDDAFRSMIDDVALRGQTVENAINRGADQITRLLQSE